MFKDSFKEIKSEKLKSLLEMVNEKLDGSDIEIDKAKALWHPLPFYGGYQFSEIRVKGENPPRLVNVIAPIDNKKWNNQTVHILDGTNKVFYTLNNNLPITLNDETVHLYVKFFFQYVRGANGIFHVINNLDDVNWREQPALSGRKALEKMVSPLSIKDKNDNEYILQATIVFKDSLFKSDIIVKKNGVISLSNQEILVEDLPIADSNFI